MKKILSLLISLSIMVGCCSFYITPASAETTFDSYTDTQNALWHLGVKGATSSVSNYSNMHYICQPFVPSSNKINGAKIGMRLTTGTATLHLEISTSVGGTPQLPVTLLSTVKVVVLLGIMQSLNKNLL